MTATSNSASQKIFKSSTVDQLARNVRAGKNLSVYQKASYQFDEKEILTSNIKTCGEKPKLAVPAKNPANSDFKNAIALYEYYRELTPAQASDPRFWSYLSHIEFRQYTQQRWPQNRIAKSDIKKLQDHILSHWFVGSNDRHLRRHALARLWWIAYLTAEPWKRNPGCFSDIKNDDPYCFTRVLLSKQDIFQQLLERGMGRSDKVLILLLDYLSKNPEIAESREKTRKLVMEINLAYGTRKITALDCSDLKKLIEEFGAEIS